MNMKRMRRFVGVVISAGLAIAAVSSASGPAAVYAIVEKVVLEPSDTSPMRIQVWGVFAIADDKPGLGYSAPQRGYMYFSLPLPEDQQVLRGARVPSQQVALTEWADLKRIAGTGAAVAFGERSNWTGRVRKPSETPALPEKYPVYNGITQLPVTDSVGPAVILRLKEAAKIK